MKKVKKILNIFFMFWIFIIILFVSILIEFEETELEDWQKQILAEQMIQ